MLVGVDKIISVNNNHIALRADGFCFAWLFLLIAVNCFRLAVLLALDRAKET